MRSCPRGAVLSSRRQAISQFWGNDAGHPSRVNNIHAPRDARAGAVDDQDGFEGFELLKPVDDRTTWLVVTRWRDEASFQAWLSSPSFAHGHRSASERGA